MSITDSLTCGFLKVGVYSILTEPHNVKKEDKETKKVFTGRVLTYQYERYQKNFPMFEISYKKFTDNFPKIIGVVRNLGKRYMLSKKKLLDKFSLKQWEKLSGDERSEHTFNCKRCLNADLQEVLRLFNIKENAAKNKAQKAASKTKENLQVSSLFLFFHPLCAHIILNVQVS